MRKWFRFLTWTAASAISLTAAFADGKTIEDDLMASEIKHVVFLMLENRSFDNVLAWLYNQDNPPAYFIPKEKNEAYYGLSEDTLHQYTNVLKSSNGEVLFSCPPIKGIPSVSSTPYRNSPKFDPHEPFLHVMKQIFGEDQNGSTPNMTGFLQDFASIWWEHEWLNQKANICAIMETYTDEEMPVLYSLARHYAVSDLWFSSVPTQTNPNRAFSICGTSEGEVINGPLGKSLFRADTIWNRLAEESPETTWMIFWQSDILPGIIRGPYSGKNTFASLRRIPNLDQHYLKIDRFHEMARNGQLPDFSFIEPQWTVSIDLDSKVKFMDELGIQSLLIGLQGNDLHPPGDVRTGENLLANIYTSLIANPEAWSKTLLIITFDEHGGLFDHVPPPKAIPPDEHAQNGFGFDRYGVRVPALFISPKISKGTVIRSENPDVPFDHTSFISTLLQWKGINKRKWNMGRRVDNAPTFGSVITLTQAREDSAVIPSAAPQRIDDEQQAISMGNKFYLRDKDGHYLIKTGNGWLKQAPLGSIEDRVALEFVGGSGKVTHGSFVFIQADDPKLGNSNLLEALLSHLDCVYDKRKQSSGQWWTVKSMEYPYVGAPIQGGDRIYLENHVYLDLFQYVPARLSKRANFFGEYLMMKPLSESDWDEDYWIIEKA
nr:alkaline phosphatase family protein [Candidatus Protochlamydia phocaeensis]